MITRYFQPLDGERLSETWILVDIYKEEGMTFFKFDNGESVNAEYIAPISSSFSPDVFKKYFAVEISDPRNRWTEELIETKSARTKSGMEVEIPPLEDYTKPGSTKDSVANSAVGQHRLIPPRINKGIMYSPLPTYEDFHAPSIEAPAPVVVETPKTFVTTSAPVTDPVKIIVDNSPKGEKKDIHMKLNVMIPSKTVYNVCKEMENGRETFIDNIILASYASIFNKLEDIFSEKEGCSAYTPENISSVVNLLNSSKDNLMVDTIFKEAKKTEEELDISFSIDMPPKSIYSVSAEFENGLARFYNAVLPPIESMRKTIMSSIEEKYC